MTWWIAESRSTTQDVDAGPSALLCRQATLKGFRTLQRGIFAAFPSVLFGNGDGKPTCRCLPIESSLERETCEQGRCRNLSPWGTGPS